MMRPICFLSLILCAVQVPLIAQDPVAAAMRTTEWPDAAEVGEGIGW